MAKAGLLFVGTDDGLIQFSDPGGIGRWFRVGQTLNGQSVLAIWPVVDAPLEVLAATSQALYRTTNGAQQWETVLEADLLTVLGHPRDAHALYALTRGGALFHSTDNGVTWQPCASVGPSAAQAQLLVAHEDATRLYLRLDDTLWLSEDGGNSWRPYGQALPPNTAQIAADPAQPGALYAIAGDTAYACAGADAAWQALGRAGAGVCQGLIVLTGKQPVLLASWTEAGLHRSEDGGATWSIVGDSDIWNGRATVLSAARFHMDNAFAASTGGQLMHSSDRGRTWQALKSDLGTIRSLVATRLR